MTRNLGKITRDTKNYAIPVVEFDATFDAVAYQCLNDSSKYTNQPGNGASSTPYNGLPLTFVSSCP